VGVLITFAGPNRGRHGHRYLPSLASSNICMFPGLVVAQDGVDDNDELPQDGGDDRFEGFAASFKAEGEGGELRIEAHSDAGCHVEGSPHGGMPRLYVARRRSLPAVPGDWRKSCESSGLSIPPDLAHAEIQSPKEQPRHTGEKPASRAACSVLVALDPGFRRGDAHPLLT